LSALIAALLAAAYALRRPRLEGPDARAAALTDAMLVALAAPCLAYWSLWSAFVYKGGLQRLSAGADGFAVNALGAAASLAALGGLLWRRRNGARAADE
jgi:hypothetical protein